MKEIPLSRQEVQLQTESPLTGCCALQWLWRGYKRYPQRENMVSLIYLQHFDLNIFISIWFASALWSKRCKQSKCVGIFLIYSQGCVWAWAVCVVRVGDSLRRRSTLDARCHWLQSGSFLSRAPRSLSTWEQRGDKSPCSSTVCHPFQGNLDR